MAHLDFDIEQHYTVGERQFILYEYFQKYTGKDRAVSRKQIFDYLKTFDITISPHTFYNDLEILRGKMKLDIQFDPHAAPNGSGGYWLKNPKFEPDELRFMVDGIQSLKFITQEKAQTITRKIKDLKSFQQIVDVIYCTPAAAPLQKESPDLPRLHIFNVLYLMLLDQIAEKIINLLFVILDGFRGQIAALAVENKLFFDGFQQHKKYTPFHGSHR